MVLMERKIIHKTMSPSKDDDAERSDGDQCKEN